MVIEVTGYQSDKLYKNGDDLELKGWYLPSDIAFSHQIGEL